MLKIIGIGESELETRLMDLIVNQENPTIAPYASQGEVTVRLQHAVPRKRSRRDANPDY